MLKYTIINHEKRIEYGLTLEQYVIADMIYNGVTDANELSRFTSVMLSLVSKHLEVLHDKGLINLNPVEPEPDLCAWYEIGSIKRATVNKWIVPNEGDRYSKFMDWIVNSFEYFKTIKHLKPPTKENFEQMLQVTFDDPLYIRQMTYDMADYSDIKKKKDYYLLFSKWAGTSGIKFVDFPTEKDCIDYFSLDAYSREDAIAFYDYWTKRKWKDTNKRVITEWKQKAKGWQAKCKKMDTQVKKSLSQTEN